MRHLSLVFVAVLVLSVAAAFWLAPSAEGQTIPPYTPYPTPLTPYPVPTPSCPEYWCAPPVIIYPTPTPVPAVVPGDEDTPPTIPGGPGIIGSTPSPLRPVGLPNAAYLHFIPAIQRQGAPS